MHRVMHNLFSNRSKRRVCEKPSSGTGLIPWNPAQGGNFFGCALHFLWITSDAASKIPALITASGASARICSDVVLGVIPAVGGP